MRHQPTSPKLKLNASLTETLVDAFMANCFRDRVVKPADLEVILGAYAAGVSFDRVVNGVWLPIKLVELACITANPVNAFNKLLDLGLPLNYTSELVSGFNYPQDVLMRLVDLAANTKDRLPLFDIAIERGADPLSNSTSATGSNVCHMLTSHVHNYASGNVLEMLNMIFRHPALTDEQKTKLATERNNHGETPFINAYVGALQLSERTFEVSMEIMTLLYKFGARDVEMAEKTHGTSAKVKSTLAHRLNMVVSEVAAEKIGMRDGGTGRLRRI